MQQIQFSPTGKTKDLVDYFSAEFGMEVVAVNWWKSQDTGHQQEGITLRNRHTGAMVVAYPREGIAGVAFGSDNFMVDGSLNMVCKPCAAIFDNPQVGGQLITSFQQGAAKPDRTGKVVKMNPNIPQA